MKAATTPAKIEKTSAAEIQRLLSKASERTDPMLFVLSYRLNPAHSHIARVMAFHAIDNRITRSMQAIAAEAKRSITTVWAARKAMVNAGYAVIHRYPRRPAAQLPNTWKLKNVHGVPGPASAFCSLMAGES